MEDKSHALAAVVFLVVLVALGAGFYFWLANFEGEIKHYRIVTGQSVAGLDEQASVTFKGLRVGTVEKIAFVHDNSARVEILLSVDSQALVTQDSYAVLVHEGLLGGMAVALKLAGDNREPLATSAELPARIPLRKGTLAQLKKTAKHTLAKIDSIATRVNKLLDKNNRERINDILRQTAVATEKLVQIEKNILPATRQLPELVHQLRATAQAIEALATQARHLAELTEKPVKKAGRAAEAVTQASQAVDALASRLATKVLPDTERLIDSLTRSVRSLRQLLEQLQAAPGSLILGEPARPPGPGEPGFTPGAAR